MQRLFAINIPLTVAFLMEMAVKQERNHCDGTYWMNLAEEIERGKYLSPREVDNLVTLFPFLREFRT